MKSNGIQGEAKQSQAVLLIFVYYFPIEPAVFWFLFKILLYFFSKLLANNTTVLWVKLYSPHDLYSDSVSKHHFNYGPSAMAGPTYGTGYTTQPLGW